MNVEDRKELSATALAREAGIGKRTVLRVLESGAIPAARRTDGRKRPQWRCPRWAWDEYRGAAR